LQVGCRKLELFHAFGQHGDAEHGNVAAVGVQILHQGDKGGINEAQLDAQIGRQRAGKVDIQAAELARARVAQRDTLVIGPDADPDLPPCLHARLHLACHCAQVVAQGACQERQPCGP